MKYSDIEEDEINLDFDLLISSLEIVSLINSCRESNYLGRLTHTDFIKSLDKLISTGLVPENSIIFSEVCGGVVCYFDKLGSQLAVAEQSRLVQEAVILYWSQKMEISYAR